MKCDNDNKDDNDDDDNTATATSTATATVRVAVVAVAVVVHHRDKSFDMRGYSQSTMNINEHMRRRSGETRSSFYAARVAE